MPVDSEIVASVDAVAKKFCRSLKRGMLYTTQDVVRDTFGFGGAAVAARCRPGEFWALDGVSMELRRGECFGLIGVNGAGKSTLLKLLNGIIRPDRGRIEISGRVGALIEVGAGFHPMLTGRENIYVNGAILGMTRRETDRKFDEIVAFSGLDGSVLDAPVKSYSSGMYVRLGFAVAVHTEPDVLLVDEVLSVGDIRFIGQCRKKIAELRRNGTSMILVSHSLSLIEETCERAMLLSAGRIAAEGPARSVTTAFRKLVTAGELHERAGTEPATSGEERAGEPLLRFVSGTLRDVEGRPAERLRMGETAVLDLLVAAPGPVTSGYFCLWLMRENDEQITGVGYVEVGRDVPAVCAGSLKIPFRVQMMPGDYRLGVTFSTDGRYHLVDQFEPCGFGVEPRPDNPFEPSGVFELDIIPAQTPAILRPAPEATTIWPPVPAAHIGTMG
jgi:lipopolysaccharide transport system ATP-binding protein